MALNSNTLKNVHRILPDQQTITLTPQNPTATAVSCAGATRRPITQDAIGLLGGVIGMESRHTIFLLPNINLSSTEPKNGDKITDSSSVGWTILDVAREMQGCLWRCTCVKQVTAE